jgi:hypothetical protein
VEIDQCTEGFLSLSTALEALRQELQTAWEAGEGQRVRFRVGEVSLTVQAVASRERKGGGKLRWWLLEAGAEAQRGSETTQTLTLALSPSVYDDQGRRVPLDVFGDQPTPGG